MGICYLVFVSMEWATTALSTWSLPPNWKPDMLGVVLALLHLSLISAGTHYLTFKTCVIRLDPFG